MPCDKKVRSRKPHTCQKVDELLTLLTHCFVREGSKLDSAHVNLSRGASMPFDTSGLPQPPDARAWSFTEGFSAETSSMIEARRRSAELKAHFVSPATGSALQFLARAIQAQHIVEIGTSTGGATQWLVKALPEDGQITSIDVDGEHHRIAKELFTRADIPLHLTRLITGRPAEVLPRLSDGAYDMVVIASDASDLNPLLDQAVRLLRLGGLVVVLDAFGGGKVGDPAQRDSATVARRLLVQRMGNDPRLTPSLLPVGDGLLAAVVNSYELPADH
ncbi:MAG: hypothetical protein RIS75_720 [Actinomycetota bacterium]